MKMTNDEQGPMENLLEGLDQQSDALSLDELKEELRGRGIEIEPFLNQIDKMIADQDRQERLHWMQVADEKKAALRVAETPTPRWIDRTREEILAAFAALSSARETAVAFRNKEKLSLEDMAEILDAHDRLARRSATEGEAEK
jgi:chromosome segregation and condensation protein ScpB